MLEPKSFGEADVVGVAVGEHDALDVVEAAADDGQFGDEVVPVAGEPGVDDGDALGGDDEVDGDDVVADAVE